MCHSEPLTQQTDRIHVANGTYYLDGHFDPEKQFCLNRLKVAYNETAPRPERFLAFLDDLLYPEDIPTLQEYMGYCLIPTNKAQKMMIITGNGGEGKSRLGLVMRSILGDNMSTNSIQSVERNRFTRATLEYKLLMVDDDMKLQALPETSYIKTMVTLEGRMDLEWKGKQSDDDGQGGLWFEIDKSRVSIRLTAPYSDSRKQKLAREAKKENLRKEYKIANE